jgi:transcriptional regulator with PAS, ATPase and Fis domain
MSIHLQIKLLRVLQEREFEPVGSDHSIRVDVRVIAATNQDLQEAIKEKCFRQDLFYRLNVIQIQLPPLRERTEDIPLLISHFITLFNQRTGGAITGFSREAMGWMKQYYWPGNVREMENMIERLVILKVEGEIQLDDLEKYSLEEQSRDLRKRVSLPDEGICFKTAVSQFEKELITQALQKTQGNKNKAADLLGLNRTTLVEKIKRKYPLSGTA